MFLAHGVEYLNPDVAAREITSRNPGISQVEANSAAWQEGKRLLERAIVEKLDFAFETTLGGRDRKSTRLNSSHGYISYAVFCLKKKKNETSKFACLPFVGLNMS